jgi:hypothetical protein
MSSSSKDAMTMESVLQIANADISKVPEEWVPLIRKLQKLMINQAIREYIDGHPITATPEALMAVVAEVIDVKKEEEAEEGSETEDQATATPV